MSDDDVIGDIDIDDVADSGDGSINWDHLDEVVAQVDDINAIADPAQRLVAAERWAAELNAGNADG